VVIGWAGQWLARDDKFEWFSLCTEKGYFEKIN